MVIRERPKASSNQYRPALSKKDKLVSMVRRAIEKLRFKEAKASTRGWFRRNLRAFKLKKKDPPGAFWKPDSQGLGDTRDPVELDHILKDRQNDDAENEKEDQEQDEDELIEMDDEIDFNAAFNREQEALSLVDSELEWKPESHQSAVQSHQIHVGLPHKNKNHPLARSESIKKHRPGGKH
jgi:hypothetical protein